MAVSCMHSAELDQSKLDRVHRLEMELGVPLMAFQPTCKWSHLDENKLAMLQKAEEELGVILLAYERA